MILTKRGGGTLVLTHRLEASKVHETEQGFTKLTVDGEGVLVIDSVGDVINGINDPPYLMDAPAPGDREVRINIKGGYLTVTCRSQVTGIEPSDEEGFTRVKFNGSWFDARGAVDSINGLLSQLPAPPAPEHSLIDELVEGGALVRGEFKIFMETWTEKTNVDGIAGLEVHVVTSPELGVNLSLRAGQGVVVYDQTDNPPGGVSFPMDEPAGTVHGRKCPDVFMEAMAPKLPDAVALFKAAVKYRKANTPEMIMGLINATKELADI